MLIEYDAVKLWVDQENVGAIALYRSLRFHQIGNCYTGYFKSCGTSGLSRSPQSLLKGCTDLTTCSP